MALLANVPAEIIREELVEALDKVKGKRLEDFEVTVDPMFGVFVALKFENGEKISLSGLFRGWRE
jgi:hypothetical protein